MKVPVLGQLGGRLRERAGDRTLDALPDVVQGGGLETFVGGGPDEGDGGNGDGGSDSGRRRRRLFRRRRRARRDEAPPTLVILPRQPAVIYRLAEFVRYRRLVFYFGRLSLYRMYRGTWLGWFWIPLRPTVGLVTQVLVFGSIIGAPSGGVPYFLFLLVGSTVWELFSFAVARGTRGLQYAGGTLRRLYVPRLTALVGGVAPAIVNVLIYVIVGLIAIGYYVAVDGTTHLHLGPQTVLVPVGMTLALLLALGVISFTAVIILRLRDIRFVIQYFLGFWFFVTPVIYPLSEAPGGLQTAISLNPMTAPVEMVRIGLFDFGHLPPVALISCAVGLLGIGIPGLIFFNRSEAAALDAF